MLFWFLFATAQFLLFLFLSTMLWSYVQLHDKYMPLLSSIKPEPVKDGVLIFIPAKDEEEGIGPCLDRLVGLKGLEYFKIVPIDDRSSDQTPQKMKEAAARNPKLIAPLTISSLPEGWLGKNHACWKGVQHGLQQMPDAQYLLFTDGDVKFHPDTVAESITWMKQGNLDFMTLIEDSEFEGILEPSYLLLFGIFLIFFAARPWLLHKPGGKNFMGNGAYLLVRREAYEQTQGHQALRLEVVEDMRMGLLMRSKEYKCGAAVGLNRIQRRWQPGFLAIFKGLLKNAFAGFEYNVPMTIVGILFFPFVFIGPWICLATGYTTIGVSNLALIGLGFWLASRNSRLPPVPAFILSPFLSLVAAANLATSAFKIIREGGVSWRGTLYPLALLKENCLTVSKAFAGGNRK